MSNLRRVAFLLFFLSGFCGLVYEVVWLRLAFASFGVITPVVSVVVSVFMSGLALGSWAGGRAIGRLSARTGLSAITFYGLSELAIAAGALAVPQLFALGDGLLSRLGQSNSTAYLAASGAVITLSILPFTLFMGTTYPWMMAFLRERRGPGSGGPQDERSFSFLYLANVVGAALGAWLTAFVLIETQGFRGTLLLAGKANLLAAGVAFLLAARARERTGQERSADAGGPALPADGPAPHAGDTAPPATPLLGAALFATGFCSMAMEVVWTRAYAGLLGNTVYAFATILTVYLAATYLGSLLYRRHQGLGRTPPVADLLLWMAVAALLPVPLADPRLRLGATGALLGIAPLCALLGYATPLFIDVRGAGDPRRAGQAYAVNILGCILGPLAASHLLLPLIVERHALALLALPLFILALSQHRRLAFGRWPLAAGAALVVWSSAFAQASSEGPPGPRRQLRTDSTATVVALGEGMDRQLLVNGVGMTRLTTITKLMVHLPLAMRREPPRKILIICFGMGTSFRSALSWGADTTAVELVPSVIESFGYFHDDAAAAVQNPLGHLVVDDGRRFLRRTQDKYDLIAIDPPPPVEAAGSGMLYSVEFYEEAKRHLAPGGVLQQWFPVGPLSSFRAVVGSLRRAFPHVRIFLGMDGWGAHLIASEEPLPVRGALELAARLPAAARRDLVEWLREGPPDPAAAAFGLVVDGELTARLPEGEEAWITDDLPLNEYVWLAHRLHPPGHGPVHPRLAPALGPDP